MNKLMKDWSLMKRLIWIRAIRGGGGHSWAWQLLTGTAPLTLPSAVSHPLKSLTQYGLCVQDGTPTPDAPVPILCNNGEIKVSRNLCDVVSANIVVGKYINNSGVESSDTANFYYAQFIPVTAGETYTMSTSSSIWYFSVMQYDSAKTFLRRTIWGATNTPVGTEKTFSIGADCAYIRFGSNMKKATISEADVLAVDWMLTQTATAQTFRPYGEIYTGGTPEVLTVSGKNLLDPSAVTAKKYINASGQELPSQSPIGWLNHSDYIAVAAGEDYTLSVTGADGGSNTIAFNWFDANKTILATRPTQNVTSGTTAYTFTSTAPADAAYLIVNFIVGTNVMVEESSTATDYQPYAQPQTVTVPMLLGLDDTYRDAEELISGIKTGKVRVVVFDGTETWTRVNYNNLNYYINDVTGINADAEKQLLCTHFGVSARGTPAVGCVCVRSGRNGFLFTPLDQTIDTVVKFNAFLAGEYAGGTPVIMVYPLATETTEQTTAHSLHTSAGTNVVDVSAAVEGVTVAVEYAKSGSAALAQEPEETP